LRADDADTPEKPAETRGQSLLPRSRGIASVSYQYTPPTDLDWEGSGEFDIHRFEARAALPLYEQPRRFLFTAGASYRLDRFGTAELVTPAGVGAGSENELFHRISVSMRATAALGEDWTLTVGVEPRLVSDFRVVDESDFELNAMTITTFALSEAWALGFGVSLNREFLAYRVVPTLLAVYRDRDAFFELEAVLPSYARGTFHTTDWLDLFVLAQIEGGMWHRNPEARELTEGGQTVTVQPAPHFYRLFSLRAGAGARFKVVGPLAIDVHAGVVPRQRHEFVSLNDSTIEADATPTGYGMVEALLGRF
jgi:hypothetical protein